MIKRPGQPLKSDVRRNSVFSDLHHKIPLIDFFSKNHLKIYLDIYFSYLVPTLSCGVKTVPVGDGIHHRSKRVVGGTEAVPGAWNWHVSLKMNGIHYCSGSILSPNFILTTHHCFGVCCFYWFYKKK